MQTIPIVVSESPDFTRWADRIWSKDQKDAFIGFIARNPLIGDVIAGTGGFRKTRWAAGGKGKSGGVRVIYFYFDQDNPVYLLLGYAKSRKDDLTETEKDTLRRIAEATKSTFRRRKA